MKNKFVYKIEDSDSFYKDFINIIDTSVDISDYWLNRGITKADYFGKFQAGKFTIYHLHEFFILRRIVLKINVEIKENTLSLVVNYYSKWIFTINAIWLFITSIVLMVGLNFYIGLALFLITILQAYLTINVYNERKKSFIQIIEKMIIKNKP